MYYLYYCKYVLIIGMALAGAGGGGFLYALVKEESHKEKIRNLIEINKLNMKIYDTKVSQDGIELNFS